jgi:hypothetical protein
MSELWGFRSAPKDMLAGSRRDIQERSQLEAF